MSYSMFIYLILLLFGSSIVLSDEEINDFNEESTKPAFIPDEFNGKLVQPLIAGDFEEFWELWTGKPYNDQNGQLVSDLYLMKTRFKHRTHEGTLIGRIPYYGSDLRFIPISDKDILAMTNGRELEIYTLWGKKKVETRPASNYSHQFAYKNWLFINETTVLDLEYALNSGRPLNEQEFFWKYDLIPWDVLERTILDYISKHCFTLGFHCIVDPDDGRLLMADTEVVAYRYGLKLSVVDSGHNTYMHRHHYYIIEDEITDFAFYVPPDLETFKRPQNFPYDKRFMLLPIFKSSDRFITTRRHRIFVEKNRAHCRSPTQKPCKCEDSRDKEPIVEIEEPMMISYTAQKVTSILLILICLFVQLFG